MCCLLSVKFVKCPKRHNPVRRSKKHKSIECFRRTYYYYLFMYFFISAHLTTKIKNNLTSYILHETFNIVTHS